MRRFPSAVPRRPATPLFPSDRQLWLSGALLLLLLAALLGLGFATRNDLAHGSDGFADACTHDRGAVSTVGGERADGMGRFCDLPDTYVPADPHADFPGSSR